MLESWILLKDDKNQENWIRIPYRIHGTGISTYIYHKTQANIPYMDPMGMNKIKRWRALRRLIHISYTISKQDLIKDIASSFLGRSWIDMMGISPTSQISQLMQLWKENSPPPNTPLEQKKNTRTSWKWNNTCYATCREYLPTFTYIYHQNWAIM